MLKANWGVRHATSQRFLRLLNQVFNLKILLYKVIDNVIPPSLHYCLLSFSLSLPPLLHVKVPYLHNTHPINWMLLSNAPSPHSHSKLTTVKARIAHSSRLAVCSFSHTFKGLYTKILETLVSLNHRKTQAQAYISSCTTHNGQSTGKCMWVVGWLWEGRVEFKILQSYLLIS